MQMDESTIRALCQKILGFSQADQTEVLFTGTQGALTRFAMNHIHQNVAEDNAQVSIRAVVGKRVGVVGTNELDDASLQKTVERAAEIARVQPENPEWHSLPGNAPLSHVTSFSEYTASYTPEARAKAVGTVIQLAKERGFEAAGAFETNVNHFAVANSLGVWAYEPRTDAEFHAVVMADGDGSGWTQRMGIDATFDFEAMAREAVDTAARSRNPIALDIGEYETVLESYAVSEMLQNLAFMGLDAQAQREGRGPMVGRLGERVAAESIMLVDDASDPHTLANAFDFEGVPTQRVVLIDHGVAKAVTYDSFNAQLEGRPNTGHALPAPNTFGPVPIHLALGAGTASVEELIKGIDRGIYVTRFHYTNPVHPVKAIFTGMTRDGTFLIEHGELTQPVKSFRFVQSIWEALNGVKGLGRERLLAKDYIPVLAPAIHVASWSFTGVQSAIA
ncbi:MAG: TldD/PmbA family protein [Ktedonobacterales bacterium]|nr:TldD/PmbA family protein [Ktedonobacterales bacterium]